MIGARKHSCTLLKVAVGVLGIAVLSGCTVDEADEISQPPPQLLTPSPTESFTDIDSFHDEYVVAVDGLADTLPQGRVFPEEPPGTWEEDATYEVGTGRVTAVLFWRCAWSTAYVDAIDSGEADGAAIALEKLSVWVSLPDVIAHSDEETRTKWVERVVKPAQAGDDSSLRLIEGDCAAG